jgi:hypothetical protein
MAKTKLIKLKDVDFSVGRFTGKLVFKETGEPKMCDVCAKDRSQWVHRMKKDPEKRAYLCFGCGNH